MEELWAGITNTTRTPGVSRGKHTDSFTFMATSPISITPSGRLLQPAGESIILSESLATTRTRTETITPSSLTRTITPSYLRCRAARQIATRQESTIPETSWGTTHYL